MTWISYWRQGLQTVYFCLKQLAAVVDQYVVIRQLSGYFKKIKTKKKIKMNKNFRWLIVTWKITQMSECLITLAVSKQLSASSNG